MCFVAGAFAALITAGPGTKGGNSVKRQLYLLVRDKLINARAEYD